LILPLFFPLYVVSTWSFIRLIAREAASVCILIILTSATSIDKMWCTKLTSERGCVVAIPPHNSES